MKFKNGAVSTEKNFAPGLAREADVGERDRVVSKSWAANCLLYANSEHTL